jgi:hypothetical protein
MWEFMRDEVILAEKVWAEHLAEHGAHTHPRVMEDLKASARERGLWNLFHHKNSGLSNVAIVFGGYLRRSSAIFCMTVGSARVVASPGPRPSATSLRSGA